MITEETALELVVRALGNRAREFWDLPAVVFPDPGPLFNVIERQRRRIALDLHDGPTQTLTATRLFLDAALQSTDSEASQAALLRASETLDTARAQLRETINNVALGRTLSEGLVRPVEDLVAHAVGLGLDATLEVRGDVDCLSPRARVIAYRVVQEALSNAVKYAPGATCRVVLSVTEKVLVIAVDDDGPGFDAPGFFTEPEEHPGGIAGMNERVRHTSGLLWIRSAPGRGTHLRAVLPSEVELL